MVELVRKFQVDVNIVELGLTGQMAAIGFSDQLRITQIFMDDLNVSFLGEISLKCNGNRFLLYICKVFKTFKK